MRESGDSSTQHQRYHAARSDEPTGTHRSNFLVDIGSTPNSSRRTMPNAEPLGLASVCRIVHRTPTSRPDARCLAMGLSWRGLPRDSGGPLRYAEWWADVLVNDGSFV